MEIRVGEPTSIPQILAEEEAIVQAGSSAIRLSCVLDRALTVGVGVRPDAPFLKRARDAQIPIFSRPSGGAAVLHEPGDLLFSIVLPNTHPAVGRDYARAFDRLGRPLRDYLRYRGLDGVEWTAPLGLSNDLCLLGGRGQPLRVDGAALGGAAQRMTRRALLHHGVVNCSLDRALLHRLFGLDPPMLERSLTSVGELRGPSFGRSELDDLGRLFARSLDPTPGPPR